MTLGQRLLAALLALAMMFAFSATLWVVAPRWMWRPWLANPKNHVCSLSRPRRSETVVEIRTTPELEGAVQC